MKICFIIGKMSFSGAEKVLSALVKNMAMKNHEINVILLEEEFGKKEYSSNITFYGAHTEGSTFKRIPKRIHLIRTIVNEISPEVVVSFGYVCNINSIVALALGNIPLIICERNDPEHDPNNVKGKVKRKILYQFADGYVFQTSRIKEYFSKNIQRKGTIIPNPVIPVVNNEEFKMKSNSNKKIITVARLEDYQKNQSLLINSFSSIAHKIKDYDLYIYGEGPDKEKYSRLIDKLDMQKRIFLCGPTNNVTETLKSAEIFVLTSLFEGMPNALIEAMSIGLPCISTDCGGGGAKALISNMKNGILVKNNDENALKEAITLLSLDDGLKEKLGKEATKVNEKLDIDNIVTQWIDYFSIVKER